VLRRLRVRLRRVRRLFVDVLQARIAVGSGVRLNPIISPLCGFE
jgi:hypothetical protein